MQRDQLESHIECATRSHLELACGELRNTQKKLKENIIHFDGLEERGNILHQQLEEKINDIQHQHQNNVDLIQQQHQRRVISLQEQLEQKVKTGQTKLDEKISRERKMFLVCLVLGLLFLVGCLTKIEERVQKSLSERNEILQMDPKESHIFIWKVTSFENKVKDTMYMESVPFYAYGYKLKLGLFPHGFGSGENTHLSIYIFVIKGEYDAILPWGFSKPVKFTLIDQQDNPDQRQDVAMGFTADPNNIAFKKPVEGERRFGFGFPEFVSHSDLKTRRFIVDDTLFIKFQVDSPKAKTPWF